MSNIVKLKENIAKIETQAQEIGTDKVQLYALLIKAYYMQKDIIVTLEEQQPDTKIIQDTDAIDKLQFEVTELRGKFAIEEAAKDVALEQLQNIATIVCNPIKN